MLRKMKYLFVALLVVWVYGCQEDTTRPDPPPPPPQLTLETYTPSNELGKDGDDVYNILVDSKDRIWFATQAGLWMKDGSTIRTFNGLTQSGKADGIPNRQCRDVIELADEIWVGTWGGGIAHADDNAINDDDIPWTAMGTADGLVSGKVYDLEIDGLAVWVTTVNGISQYRTIAKDWLQRSSGLGSTPVCPSASRAITPNRGREVWAGTAAGGIVIYTFTTNPIRLTPSNSDMPESDVNRVIYDEPRDLFWAAFPTTGIAAIDYDNRKWTRYTNRTGLLSDVCHSIAVQSDGTVWVGTQLGLTRIQNASDPTAAVFTNYIRGSGLPTERIRQVYVDKDQNVWLAFIEGGAAKVLTAGN